MGAPWWALAVALVGVSAFATRAPAVVGGGHGAPPIPAFARKYRTGCSTCHTAAPKLNVLGEAFRLNGYRFPDNDALLRHEEPVALGAGPWKDLWPRAIWPGELPGTVPLALRVQSDVQVTRDGHAAYTWSYRFPHEIYLLAGATLGDAIATLITAEWSRESGIEVVQAKVMFQDVLPMLPKRALNLWVGLQNLYPFTFSDRQIDRAGRLMFLWQRFTMEDAEPVSPATGGRLRSQNGFQLLRSQPAIEINGLAAGRLYYAAGLAQGAGEATQDNNNRKDFYYKLRYKLDGLRLDGAYGVGNTQASSRYGQLLDHSITLEHFGYSGAEPVEGGAQDAHRAFGVSARALVGPLDAGLGYVWGSHENPWGTALPGRGRFATLFGKAEYLVFPWLISSLKFDLLDVTVQVSGSSSAAAEGEFDQSRLMPGVVMLLRQNIRAIAEAEVFLRHGPSAARGDPRPHGLWLRLDLAF